MLTINEKEKLQQLLELFADQNKWCKYKYASTQDGHEVNPVSDLACSFCLFGGLAKVLNVQNPNPVDYSPIGKALTITAYKLYHTTGFKVNDELGYDAVINVIKTTLETN